MTLVSPLTGTIESLAAAYGDVHVMPTSFAQRRFWLLDQMDEEASAYTMPIALRLSGSFDASRFARALNAVVARHEALRTVFALQGDEPVQVVLPSMHVDVGVVDCGALTDDQWHAEVRRYVVDDANARFDLSTGPLLRATVLRRAGDDHVLLLSMHHIVADGWSVGVLYAELERLYVNDGDAAELPPLTLQYPDYAVWQHRNADGAAFRRQLAYWTERLANVPTLALPTDRPRPVIQSSAGAKRQRVLPAGLVAAMRELARRESVTPTTAFMAAFMTLLHRWSGQRDVVVGTITSGRSRPELEPLIGLFVNTLAVRVDVDGADSFRALLSRVGASAAAAFANQNVPFERVVDAAQPTRDTSRSPIFQAAFQLLEGIQRDLALPGVRADRIPIAKDTSKFDLTLMLHPHAEGGLRAVIEYGTELFDDATIDRMLAQYETCLESVVSGPDLAIDRLRIVPEDESRTLLVDWNATDDPAVPDDSLAALIVAQARRTPGAIAIEADLPSARGETLTFAALEQRATTLAATLRSMGVRPGVAVAVALERSCDLMVALVGVLLAGGHYVPLDPDYPDERLRYMLEDSAAAVIVTERAQRHRLADAAGAAHVLVREEEWVPPAGSGVGIDGAVEIAPEDLAYVIYTSGSTGQPKGVAIPHRAVVNYVEWMRRAYAIGAGDTLLQKAPVSFDASIWELFLPLVSGARLVLARPGGQHDPAYLVDVIRRHDVTVVQLVPSQLRMLLEDHGIARCGSLRRVVCGGEALPGSLLTRLDAVLPRIAISNVYGPTETTVYSTHWEFERETYDGTPRIGKPIANTQVYVVDAQLQPVPTGVAGELLIGGRGVARGYLNRPELTAERFVADPFRAGGRLYRTGDLARWRNDGTLEYLGRIDTQVKLRGFRIELGEVEAALTSVPGVRSAVAVVREDAFGDARLVAYVVPDGDAVPPTSQIRAAVAARLPEFMVPTAIVAIDTIPLNANGKVDRAALPAPDAAELPTGPSVAPRSDLEARIAEVWAGVLGRASIGVTDDFFALGGHSLLAMRAVARLASAVPVRLTIGTLFEARTVERLAAHVEERLAESGRVSGDDRIVARAAGMDAPLSHAQELLWIHEQMTPGRAAYNVPIVRRVRGALDVDRLQRAVDAVVSRHESLRTVFVERGGEVRQRVLATMPVRVEVVRLPEAAGGASPRDLERALSERAGIPFDLTTGPLVRVVWIPLGEHESALMFVAHHLVFDGGSIGVLLRDLDAAYGRAGADVPTLPPLPVQLADVAAWERGATADASGDAGVAFWRETLAGATLRVGLPTDQWRSDAPSGLAARAAVTLPRAVRDGVRRLARETGTTPFMVLMAAVQALLARYTGRDDIVIGTPVARRARPETQELIGHLARTIPLRLRLGGDPTFAELLQRARAASIAALRHQDAPYEPLLAELRGEGETSASIFDVLFVLQDPDPIRNRLGDLTLEPFGVAAGDAKADLVISVAEIADGLRAAVEYRADLFEVGTVQRLLSQLGTLVSAATSDPATPLSRLPLMSSAERDRVVHEFNATDCDFGAPTTLTELLDAQALRTPQAIAVVDARESIDYATLHRRADALARVLHAHGMGPGALVALVAERSVDMVIALVAILRAGGAYVPVDPEYPADRVRFMLEDCGARIVLAQRHVAGIIPESPDRSVIMIDDNEGFADADPTALPMHRAGTSDPAYMIYTSGSTGRPKGALNAHRGIVNRLLWMQSAYALTAADAVLQKTPASFDVSVWEFFWPLVAGARLVMAPPGDHRDPRAVAELIARYGITVCHFVPSMLRAFVAEPAAARCTTLRDVMASGEALPADLVAAFQGVLPTTTLHNLYGPTECAVDVSAWACPPNLDPHAVVPIGRPIANTQLYVLDATRQPLPVGVPGELYIGGVQVGLGYHGRPELSAERFVPDPFSRVPGRRMYRTGDIARWREDGTVEYLGRADDQVKVRGFRIELGEVEAAIAAFPGVARAVAAVQQDSTGAPVVNAFIVPEHGTDVDRGALAEWLRGRLPAHMVPAHVVTIDVVPLSPSGKVDRRALPLPSGAHVLNASKFVPPRGPVETVVALIFREVAKCGAVGAETSFFDVGGHSLLAARVLTFASRLFQQPLTLRMLFQAPTVAAFAAAICAGEPSTGRAARIAELFLASRSAASADVPPTDACAVKEPA